MSLFPSFWIVAAAQTIIGSGDAVFPAAVGAISLGIVGPELFTRRVGRNEAFNHAGNAFTAIAAGWQVGSWRLAPFSGWSQRWRRRASPPCWQSTPVRSTMILARGSDKDRDGQSSGLHVILECKPLLIFTASITLFHFANAAMLPLLGEKLAQSNKGAETLFMAACIITAQIVMVPMAMLVGHKADSWGRKPILLAGFAVLPIRGVLYTLTQNPYALVSIQVLDGIGAGIFGALFFIVIADLTNGTGRYNLAQGAASACWGLGAALSNFVAGFIVDKAGFSAAFLFLASCAFGAFMLLWIAMPETRKAEVRSSRKALPAEPPNRRNATAPAG